MDERTDTYDPARLLTVMALFMVFVLVVFICGIIGWQIFTKGEANTESWAALTGTVGWATGVASMLYSNRFGTTKQSEAKDATISQQARTAAVIAATASPSAAASVAAATGTGTGTGAPAPSGTQTDTLNVTALNANVEVVQPTNEGKQL